MSTVWKFPLPLDTRASALMPEGAQVLSCGMQGKQLVVWALVDPNESSILRDFVLVGTGHTLPLTREQLRFVGTFTPEPGLWFHLFEVL